MSEANQTHMNKALQAAVAVALAAPMVLSPKAEAGGTWNFLSVQMAEFAQQIRDSESSYEMHLSLQRQAFENIKEAYAGGGGSSFKKAYMLYAQACKLAPENSDCTYNEGLALHEWGRVANDTQKTVRACHLVVDAGSRGAKDAKKLLGSDWWPDCSKYGKRLYADNSGVIRIRNSGASFNSAFDGEPLDPRGWVANPQQGSGMPPWITATSECNRAVGSPLIRKNQAAHKSCMTMKGF